MVFTSPSGVNAFFEQLQEWKIDLRTVFSWQINIAVLGSGTRKELARHGIFADLMPEEYSAAALGELLKETIKERKAKTNVYIIRAKDGSKDLTEPLWKAGIVYEDIPLYETVFVQNEILAKKVKEMLLKGTLDFAAFTSASTVQSFFMAMRLSKK